MKFTIIAVTLLCIAFAMLDIHYNNIEYWPNTGVYGGFITPLHYKDKKPLTVVENREDKRPYECMVNPKKPQPKTSVCVRNCLNSSASIITDSGDVTEDGMHYTKEDFGPCPVEVKQ